MKQRRWDLVHKFEDDYRRRWLKSLTEEGSFQIMEDLYQFSIMSNKGLVGKDITKARRNFLIKQRARFNRLAS